MDSFSLQHLDRLRPRWTRQDPVRPMEQVAQALQHVHLVVDDQQGMSPSLHPVDSR